MIFQGQLAGKALASDSPFVVFSHTKGIVAACSSAVAARRELDRETARCAEWGKESDAVVLKWRAGAWATWGSLYDRQRPDDMLRHIAA
jgi:hypothetical protein